MRCIAIRYNICKLTFQGYDYLFNHVAYWVTPAGATEMKESDIPTEREGQIFKLKVTSRGGGSTAPRWGEFMENRKMLTLENRVPEPWPNGNMQADLLKPSIADFQGNGLSDSQKMTAMSEKCVDDVRRVILADKERLMAEWPKDFSLAARNGLGDCTDAAFPYESLAADDLSVQTSILAYQSRFKKPGWKDLFQVVMEYYPILWYVVVPEKVLKVKVSDTAKDPTYDTKDVRRYLTGLFNLKAFKNNRRLKDMTSTNMTKLVSSLALALPALIDEILDDDQAGKLTCDALQCGVYLCNLYICTDRGLVDASVPVNKKPGSKDPTQQRSSTQVPALNAPAASGSSIAAPIPQPGGKLFCDASQRSYLPILTTVCSK